MLPRINKLKSVSNILLRYMRRELRNVALLAFFMLLAVCDLGAQDVAANESQKEFYTHEFVREEMHIRFVVAKNKIEYNFKNNAQTLDSIVRWVEKVKNDTLVDIVSFEFCGAVSPEGSVRFNTWLSNARLTALEKHVRKQIDIPEEMIVRNDHYISWNELYDMVVISDLENKDDILRIIQSENRSTGEQLDSRIHDLKNLDDGKTWALLLREYFPEMRNAYVVIVTKEREKQELPKPMAKSVVAPVPTNDGAMICPSFLPIVASQSFLEPKYMHVKTNVVGLALLNLNAGVEFDLGNYLSVNVPISYSAVDCYKSTVKFRNFSLQPELRYWPMKNFDGLYIGAHLGFAYYNFAFDDEWRYQDKDGCTPTLGGGLSVGYRLPISIDKSWNLEFAIGAGAYPVHYDVFYNTADVREGELYDTRKGTYIGLDNVFIGISYRIPMTPKKIVDACILSNISPQ